MKVILLESTNNVGMVGEVVNVKPGFARNYLLPQNKAVIADEQNIKVFEHQKRMLETKIAKAKEAAKAVQKQLDKQEITLIRKTAKANKLFGSVTTLDIQKEIQSQLEIEVNRKGIVLAEPIKQLGSYTITIKLDGGVESQVTVTVEPDPTQVVEQVQAEAAQAPVKEEAPASQDTDQDSVTEETPAS